MDEKVVDLTEVVEEVAKWQYARIAGAASAGEEPFPEWEDQPAFYRFQFKEAVTPMVVATLKAAGVKTPS